MFRLIRDLGLVLVLPFVATKRENVKDFVPGMEKHQLICATYTSRSRSATKTCRDLRSLTCSVVPLPP